MTPPPATKTDAQFARDVIAGLEREQPQLSSKYFYDKTGSELFRQIMASPEYYLTRAEAEIYERCGDELLDRVGADQPFDLIELGAGDGSKTQLLIERFLQRGARFSYRPIDLSANALDELGRVIKLRWPNLDYAPLQADYFEALDRLGSSVASRRRLVLFPGANVGNFSPGEAVDMLVRVRDFLSPGDYLFTGYDLKKDPATILAAYNDAEGLTASFNLNLLDRINRELRADFQLDCWRHWEIYDPASGAARSQLVPIEDQTVTFPNQRRTFTFRAWDGIQVEISQKYHLREIEGMADAAGFEFLSHFVDSRAYFTDTLWRVPNR